MKAWVVLVLFCGALVGLVAEPRGLLEQPQTFPWTVGLSPVTAEEAGGLSAGALRARTSFLWFNTYRQYGLGESLAQRIDFEAVLGTASLAWSFAPGWELRTRVQGWALGGGVMDLFLSGFHGALSVPNQGRGEAPDNDYRVYWKGVLDDNDPAAGLTQADAAVRAFAGAWSWTAWVKPPVPAHRGWGWSSRWSAGTGVGWGDRWLWDDLGLLFGGGVSAAVLSVEAEPDLPGGTGPLTAQAAVYLSAEVGSGWRTLVQGSWTRVPRSGDGYVPQGAGLLTLGFQSPGDTEWTFEAALTEEFLTWATLEVGFQFGLVWTP